jgi:hypothetical protein
MRSRRAIGLLCGALAVAACEGPGTTQPLQMSLEQLYAVPDSLTLVGQAIEVTPYLYRDFKPPEPASGSGLHVVLFVSPRYAGPFPVVLAEASIWVINGRQVWSDQAHIGPLGYSFFSPQLIGIDDGPKWGPDIPVDVVLGVRAAGGQFQYVIRRSTVIHRVDSGERITPNRPLHPTGTAPPPAAVRTPRCGARG